MKKYLLTSAAALAFCGLFTSCTHDLGYDESSAQNSVMKTYEQAFITAFGQPDPNNEWGFGSTSVAGVRGGTRAVPGITFPDDFRDKTNIAEPGTIQKPTINESGATVISTSQTGSQNYDNAVIYVKNGATLTLPNGASLQHTKFYLSSGCTLIAQNLNLKGSTEFVNDGGTITIGTENSNANFVLENLTGTFWNNGSMTIFGDFTESNADGCKIYNGNSGSISAKKIFLFKNNLFRNEGVITLTNEFNADQYGHKIYNSGTITTPKITLQKEIVLWNEGTITAANDKEIESYIYNENGKIYNGSNATLKLETMTLTNNNQLVVNDGTLNVKGKITTQNNSEIVNYNKLTGGEFEMMSGSRFYNVAGGEVTIAGLSKIVNDGSGSNKDNVWMNSGKYTTGSFEATGGCQNPAAFNNCHMYVTGQFFMNHSNFVLDGGGAVECGSFKWEDDNYFHMGGKALLKVTGQLLANNNDTGYGFYGDGADYAVIQAGSIEKGSEGKFRAAYFGNLFIDTDHHFTQGENSADGTWYTFGDNVKFSFTDNTDVSGYQTHGAKTAKKAENFSITIPADPNGCTPGYKYDDDDPSSGVLRIICEDLSVTQATDWDFNDVVFDVQLVKNNQVKITLKAAGGTLPLCVGDDSESRTHEVHELFGVATNVMVNTNYPNGVTRGDVSFYLPIKEEWTFGADLTAEDGLLKAVAKNLPVEVYKLVNGERRWVTLECEKGKATAKVAVNGGENGFEWCDEREPINERYQYEDVYGNIYGAFTLFVRGCFKDGDDWANYKGPVTDEMSQKYRGQ